MDTAKYDHLLHPSECIDPIDKSGWIVLRNLLTPGDEVIIDESYRSPRTFDRSIRARIEATSNFGLLLRITPLSSANWGDTDKPHVIGEELFGWQDIFFPIKGVVRQMPTETIPKEAP